MSSFYIYLAKSRDGEMCIKAGQGAKPKQRIEDYSKQYDLTVIESYIWPLSKGLCKKYIEDEVRDALLSVGFQIKRAYKSKKGTTSREIYVTNELFKCSTDMFNYAVKIAKAVIDYSPHREVDIESIGKVNIEQLSKFNDLNYEEKIQAIEEFMASNKHYCEIEKKFPPWYELTYNNADIYGSLKRISDKNKSFNLAIDSEKNNKNVQIFNGPVFEQEGVVKFYIREPSSFKNNKKENFDMYYQSLPEFDWQIASYNFRLLEINREPSNRNEDILSWYRYTNYYYNQLKRLFGALYELSELEEVMLVQDNQSKKITINCKESVIESNPDGYVIDGVHVDADWKKTSDNFRQRCHKFAQKLFLSYLVDLRTAPHIDSKKSSVNYFCKESVDFGYEFYGFADVEKMFKYIVNAIGEAIIFPEKRIYEVYSNLSYEMNASEGKWESIYPQNCLSFEDD